MSILRLCWIIVLLPGLPALAAPPLERLFSTPTERLALDRLRHRNGSVDAAPALVARTGQITLDGYLRHSNGKATAWINHGADDGGAPVQLLASRVGGRAPALVAMRRDGQRIDLKVGQSYDVLSNTVREQYIDPPRDGAAGAAK